MKLIITTLTMVFIGFGANAGNIANVNIDKLYDFCSIFKKNNFDFKNLNSIDRAKSTVCASTLSAFVNYGYGVCVRNKYVYNLHIQKKKLTNDNKSLITVLTQTSANNYVSTKQAILSFLNFAEKNPNSFDKYPHSFTPMFLGEVFPCELDK